MSIKYDAFSYGVPWRPNYELRAGYVWFGSAALTLGVSAFTTLPSFPFFAMSAISIAMGMSKFPTGRRLQKLQKNLAGRPLQFNSLKKMIGLLESHPTDLFLGYGFEWESRHTQRVFEIQKRDTSEIRTGPLKKRIEENAAFGAPWIHGVEPDEQTLFQPLSHTEGHVMIIGTTGSGKTRAFDNFISQAILREEAVVIIDPKGDKELASIAQRTCNYLEKPERFVYFHPAFPEKSARFDMLRNFNRGTELASRIANLVPSEGPMDAFMSFAWNALNSIIQGLLIVDDRPSLIKLKRYLENGAHALLSTSIQAHAKKSLGDSRFAMTIAPYIEAANKKKSEGHLAVQMINYYSNEVAPQYPNPDLESLINGFRHDPTHFSKMIANLIPILNMLTSGPMGELLSPNRSDINDNRLIMDMKTAIQQKKVVYIGLDSLSDGVVGSAIGSLVLSDLTAVAGDRYNYGVDNRHVNVFVDEAAEVLNDPFIQLLNKGRGSLIRLFVATQTISDFSAKLGSVDKAKQVLGNINNVIALRLVDNGSQEYFSENLPMTRVKYIMRSQDSNSQENNPFHHSGGQGERLIEEEASLFPSQLLGSLPNLEFIAKISGGKIVKGRLPILIDEDKFKKQTKSEKDKKVEAARKTLIGKIRWATYKTEKQENKKLTLKESSNKKVLKIKNNDKRLDIKEKSKKEVA